MSVKKTHLKGKLQNIIAAKMKTTKDKSGVDKNELDNEKDNVVIKKNKTTVNTNQPDNNKINGDPNIRFDS